MAELQQLLNSIHCEVNTKNLNIHNDHKQQQDIMQIGGQSQLAYIKQRKAQIKKECGNSLPSGACNLPQVPNQTNHTIACIQLQLADAKALPDAQQIKTIDQTIEVVIDSHMTTCNYTAEKVAAGKKKYEAMGVTGHVVEWMKIPVALMANVIKSKGSPSKLWDQMVQHMVAVMTRVITFAKKIPGFSDLSQNDQLQLIKQGSFEVVLSRYSRLFDNTGMFLPTMEVKLPRSMAGAMPMGSFFEEQFKFADIFNPLSLEDGEIALLTAIMVMCPDRENLDDHKTVQQLQGLFLQSLYQYMKRLRPDNYNEVFHQALNTLPLLARINDMHTEMLQSMNLNTPQLHRDIFDIQ